MSLKFKFISTVSLAGAIAVFSGASMAQDANTTTPATGDKVERHHRGGRDDHARGEFGRRGGRGGFAGRGHGMFGLMKGVQLTDAQKEQFKALREQNKPNPADFEAIKPLMEARRNGTLTDDQKAQLKAFHEQRQAKMKAMHEQFLAILTPEQKAQIEANKAEQKQRRKEFKEKREEFRKNRELGAPATTQTKPAAKPGI